MRGKVPETYRYVAGYGITPAYAGKSLTIQKKTTRSRDHPRVCGEKYNQMQVQQKPKGSPPRMRGKAHPRSGGGSCPGITPAYAGKSSSRHHPRPPAGDHPRVCGEKYVDLVSTASQIGSPPRMRGKAYAQIAIDETYGITPAYAGKSVP